MWIWWFFICLSGADVIYLSFISKLWWYVKEILKFLNRKNVPNNILSAHGDNSRYYMRRCAKNIWGSIFWLFRSRNSRWSPCLQAGFLDAIKASFIRGSFIVGRFRYRKCSQITNWDRLERFPLTRLIHVKFEWEILESALWIKYNRNETV